MAFWVRPFELTIPAPSDAVLAAASAVDPNTLHDGRGWLMPGYGLEIDVQGSRITADVWRPGGRSDFHGPKLRATAESDGARTRLIGEMSWWGLATSFAVITALIVGAIYGGFWGAQRRPDEVTFSHYFFWGIAAGLALLQAFATWRLPSRMAKDEAQMKDALLRDLT
jgi:hypothetical protein